MGTPFAGNLEVYPVYRMEYSGGTKEATRLEVRMTKLPTIVSGVLFLDGDCPRMGTVPKTVLLDISGRKVLDLKPGPNDVSGLAPGVYFVRAASRRSSAASCRKVVVQR